MKALGQTLGEVGGLVGTVADGFERMLCCDQSFGIVAIELSEQDRRAGYRNSIKAISKQRIFAHGTAFNGEEAGPKTLGDYQAETDADRSREDG